MSTIITDYHNLASQGPSDNLRRQLGKFYASGINSFSPVSISDEKINISSIVTDSTLAPSIIPKKRYKVFISGKGSEFESQRQWQQFISETIIPEVGHVDHTFYLPSSSIRSVLEKNYHHADYEDTTKDYGTNQLLNISLIFHEPKTTLTKNISSIRTEFDPPTFEIRNESVLSKVMEEFPRRISNYTSSVNEISRKQRNIYLFGQTQWYNNASKAFFPFYLHKLITPGLSVTNYVSADLPNLMTNRRMFKTFYQRYKSDDFFETNDFYINEGSSTKRVFNLTRFLTDSALNTFSEKEDETFLLSQTELDSLGAAGRFSNMINSIAFIADLRSLIDSSIRDIEEIYACDSCNTYFLGYKIEKYLDRDATSTPIQTYYTRENNFFDTQMKYGREYIYKTKILLAVLGTSHSYSNVVVSQDSNNMTNNDGEYVSIHPSGYVDIQGEDYRAYADIEVSPSFKVVEHEIESRSHCFIDYPMLPPQVDFFCSKNESKANFLFSPNMFTIDSGSLDGPTSTESSVRSLVPLLESESRIRDLLDLGDNRIDHEYFYGEYEIYRMDSPPRSQSDFANHFLTSVDSETDVFFNNAAAPQSSYYIQSRDFNSSFSNDVIPNKKYYYAFRAMTYHGTPSNLTSVYEIELLKDSDEYRMVSKEYIYPDIKYGKYESAFKRLIRISPNEERLEPILTPAGTISELGLDREKLVGMGTGKTFKIRIKSKHTGKSIDLNISFKGVLRT